MGNSSYFRFDDENKTIMTKEMGKLKTHSPTYCIMDNWENMFNLTHTLDKYIWQAFNNFNVFR